MKIRKEKYSILNVIPVYKFRSKIKYYYCCYCCYYYCSVTATV